MLWLWIIALVWVLMTCLCAWALCRAAAVGDRVVTVRFGCEVRRRRAPAVTEARSSPFTRGA